MQVNVSIAQIKVAQANPKANLEKGSALIEEAARRGSHLIVFPEMWTTGFPWKDCHSIAPSHEEIITQIAALAKKYRIWICGSTLALNKQAKVAEKPSNTSILFDANGQRAGTYRKTHLFSLIHEEKYITAGDHLTTVETPWGKTGLSICYDIRFPELYRCYALAGVKLVISPSAFPHPRLPHWKILIRARAIENQMFLIACNQVGEENLGESGTVVYHGNSSIIDPWGQTVVEASETDEMLLTATIDIAKVDEVREHMKIIKDRRPALYSSLVKEATDD